jgi:hypothetical protein
VTCASLGSEPPADPPKNSPKWKTGTGCLVAAAHHSRGIIPQIVNIGLEFSVCGSES